MRGFGSQGTYLLLAGALTGCAFPLVSPGLRGELGGAVRSSESGAQPGVHGALGVSSASVLHPARGLPVELGAGYLATYASRPWRVHGAYLDAAWLRMLGQSGRLAIGARAELLSTHRRFEGTLGRGAALRVDLERVRFGEGLFASTSQGGCTERPRRPLPGDRPPLPGEPPRTELECTEHASLSGAHFGNVAYGVTAEYGVRQLPGFGLSHYGMIGFTFRLPAAALLVWGLPAGK